MKVLSQLLFKKFYILLILFLTFANPLYSQTPDQMQQQANQAITGIISQEYNSLENLYKHLHAHPELSFQEKETSKLLADELRKVGFEVTENVGGYGVVGVLKNGNGPT